MNERQAFPYVAPRDWQEIHHGMTLREWFAGMAMQSVSCGIIAEKNFGTTPQSLAAAAVEMADALLAELSKEVKNGND